MSYPNMSYCMFHNTRAAMQQLLSAMEEDGAHLLADMSADERRAFEELIGMCEMYAEVAQYVKEELEELDEMMEE